MNLVHFSPLLPKTLFYAQSATSFEEHSHVLVMNDGGYVGNWKWEPTYPKSGKTVEGPEYIPALKHRSSVIANILGL